jgi:hypothetical protein
MFQCFARPRVLAIAAGLSLVLVAPLAGLADEPNLAPPASAFPRMEHIMGSGGLGSRLEETVIICAPPGLATSQHLLGSGGMGSRFEETLVPVVSVDSGNC